MRIDADTVAKASRLEALARRVGFAVLQVQALESASAQYLVLRSKATRGMGVDAAQRILEKARKETFGTTIGAMKNAGLLSEELANRFKALLKERNWLVHRSRTENSAALTSDDLASVLVARIDRAEDESRKLLHELAALSHTFVLDSGVPAEVVNAAISDVVQQWESNDAI